MSPPKNIQNDEIKEISKDKRRRRKITWFNPAYSKNVITNIGKKFFNLLSMCFPPENKLYKITNNNTIKLSCSCMNNIHQIITSHNKTVLSNEKSEAEQTRQCNCRNKTSCPLQGKCLQKGVIYQATIMQSNTGKQDTYIGVTENEFKTRYNQHTSSFKFEHRSSTTTLSEHIWKLKKNKIDHNYYHKVGDTRQSSTLLSIHWKMQPLHCGNN